MSGYRLAKGAQERPEIMLPLLPAEFSADRRRSQEGRRARARLRAWARKGSAEARGFLVDPGSSHDGEAA
jgi:hypothetical protein